MKRRLLSNASKNCSWSFWCFSYSDSLSFAIILSFFLYFISLKISWISVIPAERFFKIFDRKQLFPPWCGYAHLMKHGRKLRGVESRSKILIVSNKVAIYRTYVSLFPTTGDFFLSFYLRVPSNCFQSLLSSSQMKQSYISCVSFRFNKSYTLTKTYFIACLTIQKKIWK